MFPLRGRKDMLTRLLRWTGRRTACLTAAGIFRVGEKVEATASSRQMEDEEWFQCCRSN